MDLLLFGIQGSGKGTQAKKLAEEFGYSIFETGAELRAIAATDSDIGRRVKEFVDQGLLAPLEVVMAVVKQAILARPADQKILFDGIPRDLHQMAGFDVIMEEIGRPFQAVQLTVNEEEAIERIVARAKEQGRADDQSEEFIRRRMGIFKEKTVPVIEVYRARGMVTDVDGEGTVQEVYERLKNAVRSTK